MMNLKMANINERSPLKRYFYDEDSSNSNFFGKWFWISLILSIFMFGIPLVIYISIKIASLVKSSSGDEAIYDSIFDKDINFLKDRAVNVMGFISEELSMIPPILTHGYARESNSVKKSSALDEDRRSWFQKILSIKNLFTKDKEYISHSVFLKGHDERVRCSLVSITMISFTEQQVVAYVCDYDIALGVILNEYVNEVFYRDVESVTYGVETWHVPTNDGSIARIPLSWARITVPSGENIVASMYGENDMLENQVTAMKNLIRSKKEEMT